MKHCWSSDLGIGDGIKYVFTPYFHNFAKIFLALQSYLSFVPRLFEALLPPSSIHGYVTDEYTVLLSSISSRANITEFKILHPPLDWFLATPLQRG